MRTRFLRPAQRVTQPAAIYGWFLKHRGRHTPSEVQAAFPRWLLTSVRRALHTLTERELLRRHDDDRRRSPRRGRESTWSLAR
jgi:Fe2+ or Zn2+ uptake regulation protein